MWVLLVTRKRMLRRVEQHQLLPLAVCRFLHGISTPLSALFYAPSGSGSGTLCVEISSESSSQLSNPGVRVCARTDKKRSCFAGCVSAIHTQRTAISSRREKPMCPRCLVPLTVCHILLACPNFSSNRARHLGRIAPHVTIRHLLGDDSAWVQTGALFSYILDIKFPVLLSISS